MGRYALMLYKGVPGRWIFLKQMALLLIQDTIDATWCPLWGLDLHEEHCF